MKTAMKKNAIHIPRLLILGVHGLDWNLISEKLLNGTLPHLAVRVSEGASGPLHSVDSINRGSDWTSLATGRRAFRHGVLDTDWSSNHSEESSQTREGPALWNILSQAGIPCGVIGWPGVTKAEKIRGLMVAPSFFAPHEPAIQDWPIPEGSVTPAAKAGSYSAFRLHPDHVPDSWCGTFVPTYFSEEPEAAIPLSTVRSALAIDRSKLNLAIHWAQKEEWRVLGLCLSGLDAIGEIGMPYHSTPVSRGPISELEIFGGLVDRVYEWYDGWIEELLSALPSDTNVLIVSDHGVNTRRRQQAKKRLVPRYSPQVERGCLIASGPDFAKQIPIRRATLLDVCPTVLSLYGIQQEQGMDGIVLENVLAFPKRPAKVVKMVNWNQASMGTTTKRRNVNSLAIQELCRLGVAFLDAGRLLQAITSLQTAWQRLPHSLEIAWALALALFQAGLKGRASTVLQISLQASEKNAAPPVGNIGFRFEWTQEETGSSDSARLREILTTIAQWLENPDKISVNQLFELFRASPDSFLLSLICGVAASQLGSWKDAQVFLSRAAALNTSDAESLVEIARIHLYCKNPKAALKTVRLAMEKAPLHLRGNVVLAEALLALGQIKEASAAATKAASLAIEQRRPALLILAKISRLQGDQERASRYLRAARRIKRQLATVEKSFSSPPVSMQQVVFSSSISPISEG